VKPHDPVAFGAWTPGDCRDTEGFRPYADRHCLACDVLWRGEPACWNCGEMTAA
jgi:hypothetical protein